MYMGKRPPTLKLRRPNAILLDIEGTISDIRFGSRILFPFTKSNIRRYFEEQFETKEAQEMIERLRKTQRHFPNFPTIATSNSSRNAQIRSISEYALQHIIQRSHISEIKQLQILIWIWGYEKGLIKGHLYDEVTTILHQWKYDFQIKIYLFSSAMIQAQQLLLCFTNHGNCLPLISDFFDSSIGDKTDKQSYLNISQTIGERPKSILFITDNPKEAVAASDANYNCLLIKRIETSTSIEKFYDNFNRLIPVINSLDDIKFV